MRAARVIRWWQRLAIGLRRTVTAYNADNCGSFASAIAYNALLALVPLTVFLLAVAGLVLRDPTTQERVRGALLANLPITTATGRAQLQDALTALAQTRPVLGGASFLLAAYAARGLILHLRTGLAVAFHRERHRSLVQGVLIDLCLAVGLGLLLLLSLTLTLALAVAQTADQRLFGEPLPRAVTVLFTLIYAMAPVLVSLLVFAVLYRVAARTVLTWRTVLPGALLAAVAFEIIKVGFAQYAARGGASTTVGALGGVVAVLALPHFGAQITLFGAVFARVYHDLGGSPAVCPYHRGHTAHQPDLIRRGRIPGAAAHRLPEPHERRVGGTSVNGDSAAPLAAAAAVGLLGAAVLLTPWLRQTLRRRARHWHHRHRPEH